MPDQPNQSKPLDRQAVLNSLAGAFGRLQTQTNQGQQPTLAAAQGQPKTAPTPDDHTRQMQQAAEAAKQKYMLENGVDENGELVKK